MNVYAVDIGGMGLHASSVTPGIFSSSLVAYNDILGILCEEGWVECTLLENASVVGPPGFLCILHISATGARNTDLRLYRNDRRGSSANSAGAAYTRHYRKLILSGADGTVYNAISSNEHNNKFNNRRRKGDDCYRKHERVHFLLASRPREILRQPPPLATFVLGLADDGGSDLWENPSDGREN
ncbi:hypothetical protein EVAR_52438_1 [Eumeta japonica]|uniref:Uncharacterized protein n=1 Tax=Eumeta variegata TaxID=151549 RepID=A0A4C1YNX4_EUMVA|nr:hypothetical protein EVAR_52438_1 [Eumeta japonica]